MASSSQPQSVVICVSRSPEEGKKDINATLTPGYLTEGSTSDHLPSASSVPSSDHCAKRTTTSMLRQTSKDENLPPLSMRLTPCPGPQTYLGISSFRVATIQAKPTSSLLPPTDGNSTLEAVSATSRKSPAPSPRTSKIPGGETAETSSITRVAVNHRTLPSLNTETVSSSSSAVKTQVSPTFTPSPLALKVVSEILTPLPRKTAVRNSPSSVSVTTQVRKSIVLIPRKTEPKPQQRQAVVPLLQKTLFSTGLDPASGMRASSAMEPTDPPPQERDSSKGCPMRPIIPLSPQNAVEGNESPQELNEKKVKKGQMVWAKGLGPGGPVLMKKSYAFKYKSRVMEPNKRAPYPGYTKIHLSPMDSGITDTGEKRASKTPSPASSDVPEKEKSVKPPATGSLKLVGFMSSLSPQTAPAKESQTATSPSTDGGPSPVFQPTARGPAGALQLNVSEKEHIEAQEKRQKSKEPSNPAPLGSLVGFLALYVPTQAICQEPQEKIQPGGAHDIQKNTPSSCLPSHMPKPQQSRDVGYLIPVQSLQSNVPLELPAPCKGPNDASALPSPCPAATARGSKNNKNTLLLCKYCRALFSSRDHFNQHVNAVTSHRCYRCSINFATAQELSRHQLDHKSRQRQRCEYCDQPCANIKSLRLHRKRWHAVAEAHDRENCAVCKSVLTRTKLREHLQVSKSFFCLECHDCFYTFRELDAHIKKSHGMWAPAKGEPAAVGAQRPCGKKRKARCLASPQESQGHETLSATVQSSCDLASSIGALQSPCNLTIPSVSSQSSCDLTPGIGTLQSPCDLPTPSVSSQSSCDLTLLNVTSQSPCDLTARSRDSTS